MAPTPLLSKGSTSSVVPPQGAPASPDFQEELEDLVAPLDSSALAQQAQLELDQVDVNDPTGTMIMTRLNHCYVKKSMAADGDRGELIR